MTSQSRLRRAIDSLPHQKLGNDLFGLDELERLTNSAIDRPGSHFKSRGNGFADASNLAYAAAVYLKVVSQSGHVTITLLVSKSKVAPLKPLSIPRLELSAAVLLSRLVEFVRQSLEISAIKTYCWTDSTTVLTWVTQHPSKWKVFVANRVAEIQTRAPDCTWRHAYAYYDKPHGLRIARDNRFRHCE